MTDVADALITVLHRGEIGSIYNIGTDFEISNLQLARLLISEFETEKDPDQYLEFVQDRAFNDKRYAIDSSKMEAIGWKPKVSWKSGIAITSKFGTQLTLPVAWFRENMASYWGEDVTNVLTPHPLRKIAFSK